jgi:hypothetical protein
MFLREAQPADAAAVAAVHARSWQGGVISQQCGVQAKRASPGGSVPLDALLVARLAGWFQLAHGRLLRRL